MLLSSEKVASDCEDMSCVSSLCCRGISRPSRCPSSFARDSDRVNVTYGGHAEGGDRKGGERLQLNFDTSSLSYYHQQESSMGMRHEQSAAGTAGGYIVTSTFFGFLQERKR